MRLLKEFKVVAFDTMGTLLDEKQGIAQSIEAFFSRLPTGTTQLDIFNAYESDLRQLLKTEKPPTTYANIMENAISRACNDLSAGTFQITPSESTDFAASLAAWPPFSDTIPSLQYLASKGHKLILVSNMDTRTLQRIADEDSGSLKDVTLSELIGCDVMHTFKPNHIPTLLEVAKRKYGAEKDDVLLVAQGLATDHVPALEFNLASALIDRYGSGKDAISTSANPGWIFDNLEELCVQYKEEEVKLTSAGD